MAGRVIRLLLVVVMGASAVGVWGQQLVSPELKAKLDAAVKREMEATGVPSASVGAVQGGKIVYTAAFGQARLPAADGPGGTGGTDKGGGLAATPEMHYAIGSISKQFTTACILLLAESGKLTLDDPVSRWFPELTRSNEVKLRNLLTHTSGYEDYAPQDYTIPLWMKPTKPLDIVHEWAEKPLDFDPGTKWQYSNTNFVLAGLIVEKASGMPFWEFLETQVLRPLKLEQVLNLDTDRDRMEPLGYMRNALGPLRPAVLEAPGWYFADGAMSMPVETLLRWDISVMDRTLLKAASYDVLETEMKLKDGTGTKYGLGVQVAVRDGHRSVFHSGEVGGFVAANAIYPDEKIAVAVLTNQEASPAAGRIQRAVAALLLPAAPVAAPVSSAASEVQVKGILTGLQQGKIDRSLFTPDCNFYFSQETIGDFETSLAPLGEVQGVTQIAEELRGGMTFRTLAVVFENGTRLTITTYTTKDGKLEQFLVEKG
jgi:D-alanyl-D-alanine carboxypeptidase